MSLYLVQWSSNFEAQNRSFSARFPSKRTLWSSKTKLFCETSFKNDLLTRHLTSESQYALAIFKWMLQKYCACHEKVEPRHTNSCNCHTKWSLLSNMSVTWKLQPFHGFSVRDLKQRRYKQRKPMENQWKTKRKREKIRKIKGKQGENLENEGKPGKWRKTIEKTWKMKGKLPGTGKQKKIEKTKNTRPPFLFFPFSGKGLCSIVIFGSVGFRAGFRGFSFLSSLLSGMGWPMVSLSHMKVMETWLGEIPAAPGAGFFRGGGLVAEVPWGCGLVGGCLGCREAGAPTPSARTALILLCE